MDNELFSVRDRVAIVTGGLGNLGQRFCVTLVNAGARVACCDIAETTKIHVPGFAEKRNDGSIHVFRVDLTKRHHLEETLTELHELWGWPSILINNAGLHSPPGAPAEENGPFETYPESSYNLIMDANLKGMFLSCQVFGGAMAKEKHGSIVNIASTYGLVSPNQDIYAYKRKDGTQWFKPAAYAVAKSAVFNLTRYLATYWAHQGVRVNTLTPGGIFENQDKEFLSEYEKRVPMGRMADPDEMNGAVLFLASQASSYVTGANIVVDGGWTAW
ncbi:MAG: SDR family oxidoreductase [Parcubacteria group bacterium]